MQYLKSVKIICVSRGCMHRMLRKYKVSSLLPFSGADEHYIYNEMVTDVK